MRIKGSVLLKLTSLIGEAKGDLQGLERDAAERASEKLQEAIDLLATATDQEEPDNKGETK